MNFSRLRFQHFHLILHEWIVVKKKKFGEVLKLLWIFFFADPSVSLFHIEMCSLAPCSQIPHCVFFFFNTSDQVCFLLLCENIFLFPTHFEVFFLFPQIFLFRTHFRRLHPHSTFSSSPATFLFQSLTYLISLIAHNFRNPLPPFFRLPSASLKQNQIPVT